MGGDGDFAAGRVLEGFGGVVNQVDDDAAEERAIGAHGGEMILDGVMATFLSPQAAVEAALSGATGPEIQN